MIYNLENYLTTEMTTPPAMTVNGFKSGSPEVVVCLNDTGGNPEAWLDQVDNFVQLLSRAPDITLAKSNCEAIYNFITKRFGLKLPEVTISSIVYPEVIAWQITAVQSPSWLGPDEKGLQMYVCNLKIITDKL